MQEKDALSKRIISKADYPTYIGEYSSKKEKIDNIKSFILGSRKISHYACEYHDKNHIEKSHIESYTNIAIKIALIDFKIYKILKDYEEKGDKETLLDFWNEKNKDAYYRLFNPSRHKEINNDDLAMQLISLYLYPNYDYPENAFSKNIGYPKMCFEFDVSGEKKIKNSHFLKLKIEQRNLFIDLIKLSHPSFTVNKNWSIAINSSNHTAILHGFRRIFLERKRFFLSFLSLNIQYLSKSFELNEITSQEVEKELDTYGLVLNDAQDYIFFPINTSIDTPLTKVYANDADKPKDVDDNESIKIEIKKLIQEINDGFEKHTTSIISARKKQKETLKNLRDLIKKGVLINQNQISKTHKESVQAIQEKIDSIDNTKSIEEIKETLNNIQNKLSESENSEKKYQFIDTLFEGSLWMEKDKTERKKKVMNQVSTIGSIASGDIGSWIGHKLKGDSKEDLNDLGNSLINDIVPVFAGAIGLLFGGPIGSAFLQGIAGAFINSPPDPLLAKIDELSSKIDKVETIIIDGFNQVLKDTQFLIKTQNEIKEQINGVEAHIDQKFKQLFEEVKKFLEIRDCFKEIEPNLIAINTLIRNINNDHSSIFKEEKSTISYAVELHFSHDVSLKIENIINAFFNDDYKLDTPFNFSDLEISNQSIEKTVDKIRNICADEDFIITTRILIELCDYIDKTLLFYGANYENHIAINAAIACYRTKEYKTKLGVDTIKKLIWNASNQDLKSNLRSHGKLLKSLIIGQNNLTLYSSLASFIDYKKKPTFMNGFILAEVDHITYETVTDKFNIPTFICFNKDSSIDITNQPVRNYLYTEYDDIDNLGKNTYQFASILPGEKSPTYLKNIQLKLGYNDTCVLINTKNKKQKIVRIIPFDYEYIHHIDKVACKLFGYRSEHYAIEYIFSREGFKWQTLKNLQHKINLPNFEKIQIDPNRGSLELFNETLNTTLETTLQPCKYYAPYDYSLENSNNSYYLKYYEGTFDYENYIKHKDNPAYKVHFINLNSVFNLGNTITRNQFLSSGSFIYSENFKYKLVMQESDGNLIIYNEQTGESVWEFGATAKGAYLHLKYDGTLIIKVPKGVEYRFSQRYIHILSLSNNGVLNVSHKHPVSGKIVTRRLIANELRKGDQLFLSEYIYSKEKDPELMKVLINQYDRLILSNEIPKEYHVVESSVWEFNYNHLYRFPETFHRYHYLEILDKKLIIKGLMPGQEDEITDKNETIFKFPQRHIENLYVENGRIKINNKTEKDPNRRLIVFMLLENDILYNKEEIYSIDLGHGFTLNENEGMVFFKRDKQIIKRNRMKKEGEEKEKFITHLWDCKLNDDTSKKYSLKTGTIGKKHPKRTFQVYKNSDQHKPIMGVYSTLTKKPPYNTYLSYKIKDIDIENRYVASIFNQINCLYIQESKLAGIEYNLTENSYLAYDIDKIHKRRVGVYTNIKITTIESTIKEYLQSLPN